MSGHSCAFCTNPENKEREIVRSDLVWAFPTNIPIVPGHLLVAPLRCVPTMGELTNEERTALLAMVEELKMPLRSAFGAEGFNQAWNEGESAGQTVSHVHIHLLPRKRGDEGVTSYEPRQFLYRPGSREKSPQKELLAIAEQVRHALRS
jgi:diadenosine tetraphosphate (Ap4A) HIT family hydrolase